MEYIIIGILVIVIILLIVIITKIKKVNDNVYTKKLSEKAAFS